MEQELIDLYCERVVPGIWAEPLNAVTNLAFFFVGLFLVRDIRRNHPQVARDPSISALVLLVFLIGSGSGLFHTLAVRWAMWADIIPITLFTLAYLYFALRRFFQVGVWTSLACVMLMLFATGILPALTMFRGTTYVPALLAMVSAGTWLRAKRNWETGNALLAAGGLFAISLSFRTADAPICDFLPIGTHFLWHVLNAIVVYILIRAMVRFGDTDLRVHQNGARR